EQMEGRPDRIDCPAGEPLARHRRERAGHGEPAAQSVGGPTDAGLRSGQRLVVRLLPRRGRTALRRTLLRAYRLRPPGGRRLPQRFRRHPRPTPRGPALDGPGPEEERPRFCEAPEALPPSLRRTRRLPLRNGHRRGPHPLRRRGRKRPLGTPDRQHRDL
ncbi:MAG: hypothetical protein AVDCRST_MAG02-808, partial [uncultured Rubrobacteraceae bacterium]